MERALELLRQAELRVPAGAPPLEAIQHGEAGLTSVPHAEAEEFLERLAALADNATDVVDLYERQVTRAKSPSDWVDALARAAQVAAAHGQAERAPGLLRSRRSPEPPPRRRCRSSRPPRARATKRRARTRCGARSARALEHGGQGARDGGRTRGALLRRAALMTHRDLKDLDEAFVLFGVALVAHVDPLTLDALEALAEEIGDPRRAEETLSHVLEEVFDGPLVRQLLARRAKLRREQLKDTAGAAADLKKLHDLSPNDASVLAELTALLTELGDYRGMVRVFEDQILRGKDMSARAELARKVARMWEVELSDAREAADAWRRVLRMKQGDPEATAGLDRAKSNMLKTLDPSSERRPSTAPGSTGASERAGAENAESRHARAQEDVDDPRPRAPELARESHAGASTRDDTPETAAEVRDDRRVRRPRACSTSIADEDRTRFDPVRHPRRRLSRQRRRTPRCGEAAVLPPAAAAFPKAAPPPIDFSDATLPHGAAAPPPTESELIIDVDASGEAPALDDEMLLADDLDGDGRERGRGRGRQRSGGACAGSAARSSAACRLPCRAGG